MEWLKKEGELVAQGDILFTVETDKSVMEVQSFEAGTLLKIVVPPRVAVPVQTVVGFLGQPGDPLPAVTAPAPKAMSGATAARIVQVSPTARTIAAAHLPPATLALPVTASTGPVVFRISPRATALARRRVIDPAAIIGSGPMGRILEKDVKQYLEARGYHKLRVTPAARELAAREGVDLLAVSPGEGGRITLADVQLAVAEKPRPMSRIRQVIAQRLTQSFRDTPHFYVTVSVDMTDLVAYRAQLKQAGAPYTVTDFIAKASVLALQEFPDVNSSTDGRTRCWHGHINLGIAVSLEQGLVVPVIRAAERLTLQELSRHSKALADKARAGRATPDELSGGTFTISNLGMMNVESFGAIINPGESGILAVASILPQPVVRAGQIAVRQIMKLTLSCDHRIVDGALGAKFINAIKQKLEDIELWKHLTS